MAESDENNHLERWARIMNKGNGYAGVFNYENGDDKRIVESGTIEEWRASVDAEFGVHMDTPWLNPNDPPDFHVKIGGKCLSVELVQLVEEDHKKRAAKGETPFAGQLFLDAQWSRERLISKVSDVICKKGEKYKKVGVEIDVLVIHTAETWLTSGAAREWLECASIKTHPSIRTAHLLFQYETGRGNDHWPLLPVYGDLSV